MQGFLVNVGLEKQTLINYHAPSQSCVYPRKTCIDIEYKAGKVAQQRRNMRLMAFCVFSRYLPFLYRNKLYLISLDNIRPLGGQR